MEHLPLNLLTFPLWWYTTGWNILWDWNKRQLDLGLRQSGLAVFAHHFKEPLYGDYTKSGIFLGFFFRTVLLIFKLLFLFIRLMLIFLLDLLFLLLVPVVLAMIIFQLIPKS
jgi:hypothetical protein